MEKGRWLVKNVYLLRESQTALKMAERCRRQCIQKAKIKVKNDVNMRSKPIEMKQIRLEIIVMLCSFRLF